MLDPRQGWRGSNRQRPRGEDRRLDDLDHLPFVAPVPEEQAGVSEAELAMLRGWLEAVNLRGLAEAVDALLGEHPAAVCEVLAVWAGARLDELPRLTPGCWVALAPLGVSVPPGLAPRVLDDLLAGVHAEVHVALDALRDCRDRADRVPPALPPGSGAAANELRQRALVAAVGDFWALIADICARIRRTLLAGDHTQTTWFLEVEKGGLRPVVERIEVLANQVAGTPWQPMTAPLPEPLTPEAASGPQPPVDASLLVELPAPLAGRLPESVPMERWLPIAFLVLVTCLAVGVLLGVLYASPGPG